MCNFYSHYYYSGESNPVTASQTVDLADFFIWQPAYVQSTCHLFGQLLDRFDYMLHSTSARQNEKPMDQSLPCHKIDVET